MSVLVVWASKSPAVFLSLAALTFVALFSSFDLMAEGIIGFLPIDRESHLAGALHFFLYDSPKVLLLLTGISFVMGMLNSYFTPDRTRKLLTGRNLKAGNVVAASLGIFTPFCSCSAITLFIGFLQAGVPLGMAFSYLIAAPMVNEVALALLFGLFGWKIAALYMVLGLTIAITAGWALGKMKLERNIEQWVLDARKPQVSGDLPRLTLGERVMAGFNSTALVVGKVWIYILIGVAIGAGIHGYVPQDFMASIMGKDKWWSVPLAVAVGVPMYTNAAGVIPVVQALLGKGAALGTVLAFMMSVVALSLPEMIILRRVLKWKLIGLFVGVVATGILIVGFVFNAVL